MSRALYWPGSGGTSGSSLALPPHRRRSGRWSPLGAHLCVLPRPALCHCGTRVAIERRPCDAPKLYPNAVVLSLRVGAFSVAADVAQDAVRAPLGGDEVALRLARVRAVFLRRMKRA